MNKIIEITLEDKDLVVEKNEQGLYNMYIDNKLTQPLKDADGMIRALGHILHNTSYKLSKKTSS